MRSSEDLGFFATDVSLAGKCAIVTGSSRGIGRAIALELAREGCDVLVNYLRDRAAAEAVAGEIAGLGRRAVVVQADVGDLGQHPKLVDAALVAFGRIDLLINNAGIVRVTDVLEETVDDFDAVIDTNLKAPHFLTQRVVNYMIANRIRGCIIYTLSMNDRLASDNRPAYCISKAGLEMSMKLFAGRVAEHLIKVNGVQVGATDTDLVRVRIPEYQDAARKGYISMVRPGVPEDMARATIAAIKLYETGAQIPATGGIMTGLLNLRRMTELESNRRGKP
jgi:NAD(P)-dependent dehydrogenase (short-subunit alcohol dehydrogenase family)